MQALPPVPLGFFLFLVELAAGGLLVTVVLDWEGEVSPGFLLLNGVFLFAFAACALWLRSILPAARLLPYPGAETWIQAEPWCWAAFALLAAAQLLFLRLGRRGAARAAGSAAAAAGLVALAVSAAAYRPATAPAPLVALSFLAAALALGTVWSGMMLGHWYLVTPRLAPRPLLRLNAALAAVLFGQAMLLLAQGLAGAPGARLDAPGAWLFWLRAGVGVVFPLALSAMVWRTARVRSMMSATGLLYVALGAVMAGEIISKALFFTTRTPL